MTKFKPGDRVRFKSTAENRKYVDLHFKGATEFTIRSVDDHATWPTAKFENYSAAAFLSRLELVPNEPPKDPHLPLTFILEMDRVLAQASVKADTLDTYLDKPLSAFIRDVMEPNYLSLKFGA
jgi:hypothetical protein